jgi:hypothetical protein
MRSIPESSAQQVDRQASKSAAQQHLDDPAFEPEQRYCRAQSNQR